MPQVMFTLPMAEMQPHGIVDAKCAPKERKDRKMKRKSRHGDRDDRGQKETLPQGEGSWKGFLFYYLAL